MPPGSRERMSTGPTPRSGPMSDAQGLLAAICDQPEDDAPRLVYADWLEEHGQADDRARAELIRVQCAAARLPPQDEDIDMAERRTRLELRADELLYQGGGE